MHVGLSQQLALEFRRKIETGQWRVGRRLPTTRELAAEYDVSVNTVQNAFRELEARDLVVRHPRRGGYVKPNGGNGRPHQRPNATTVGIVGPHIALDDQRAINTWSYWIIQSAQHELRADYHLSLFSFAEADAQGPVSLLPRIERMQQDLVGVICFPQPGLPDLLAELDRLELPWVTINRLHARSMQNFVMAENFDGGQTVGRCFGRCGFDRVAVLGNGMVPGSSTMEKLFGFIQGYLEAGMCTENVDYVVCRDYDEAAGYEGMSRFVERHGQPRGVFATGDFLALGALRLCRERGWKVPQDVGIVGATGLDVAKYSHPSISVLAQPMKELGVEAVRMLMKMASQGVTRCEGKYISSPFIVRESLSVPPRVLQSLGSAVGIGA